MDDKLLSCINSALAAEKVRQREEAETRARIEQREREKKEELIPKIRKYFEGLNESQFTIRLQGFDPQTGKSIKPPESLGDLHHYEVIYIYIGRAFYLNPSVEIHRFSRWFSFGEQTELQYWNYLGVVALYHNLDWFGQQIAKKYGCDGK